MKHFHSAKYCIRIWTDIYITLGLGGEMLEFLEFLSLI